MRFTQMLPVSEPLEAVRQLIVERHKVASSQGLQLYLGEECIEQNEFKPEDYSVSLQELSVEGGSQNDAVRQVITYEHAPFSASILQVPRNLPLPKLASTL